MMSCNVCNVMMLCDLMKILQSVTLRDAQRNVGMQRRDATSCDAMLHNVM